MIGVWIAAAFLCGSLPFSLWLGRLALNTDIRRYGDGNPGSANAWRAGGARAGVPALLLDFSKGAVPVALAHFVGRLSGWELAAVALAPVLGHAFSPFLRFHGGKALAVTFGIWTGLTLGEGPILLGLLFAFFYLIQDNDGWAVIGGMIVLGLHLLLRRADATVLGIWAGNTLILAWKHRHVLAQAVHPRPGLVRWLEHVL